MHITEAPSERHHKLDRPDTPGRSSTHDMPLPSDRLPWLDGLRLAAFALLVPYHVGMYYVSWDWHVKSPHTVQALEPFLLITAPWRLGLLFFIGGVACQGLLARRGAWAAVRDRSSRLLWPLLFGMAVVVTPQAYFEVLTKAPQQLPGDGGYLDFWQAYLAGGRYCRGNDCMRVPTWNHLWFLPYLWLYALLGIALTAVWRAPLRRRVLPGWAWMVLPVVPLALARLALFPRFGSTHDFTGDLYNHVQYFLLFAFGWASRSAWAQPLWPWTLRLRWPLLLLCIGCWLLLFAYFAIHPDAAPPLALLQSQRVLWAAYSWWAVLAACGWAQRAFRHESPRLRAASAAVFCLYVLHQSVIVLLTQALRPLSLPWGLEAPLLVALTMLIGAAAYVALRGVPVLRVLVGIPGRPAAPGAVRSAAA